MEPSGSHASRRGARRAPALPGPAPRSISDGIATAVFLPLLVTATACSPAPAPPVDERVALRDQARAAACPPDDVIEALHAAIYRLERGDPTGEREIDSLVRAPLDGTTRDLVAQLHRAALRPDAHDAAESLRARLADWPCLTADKHRTFHARLPQR
jgi:hypothetical protein